jgi:sigma-B regulation protein RsbU (phosphoserine phosphatase)
LHFRSVTGIVYELATSNPPIGIFKEQTFDSSRAQFSSGDIAALLTDGLTEVMDSREEEYGLERIKHLLANHSAQPLNVICEMLMSEAREFGKQADDQSVLLVRWR